MKVAIIPARGGSKRIPRKNIKEFAGRPMISWSIETAIKSALFESVIVTTDDDEIAEIARFYGAQTPFSRPKDLADDFTPTVPVIAHAIRECNNIGIHPEYVCCIYPCTPFLQIMDLQKAFMNIVEYDADFVYPVTEYAHPIQRAMRMLPNSKMQFISSEFEMTRTQDLEKSFHDSGQFYFGTAAAWLGEKKMHTAGQGMKIPNWRVVDIDSVEDWHRAELIYKSLLNEIQ